MYQFKTYKDSLNNFCSSIYPTADAARRAFMRYADDPRSVRAAVINLIGCRTVAEKAEGRVRFTHYED